MTNWQTPLQKNKFSKLPAEVSVNLKTRAGRMTYVHDIQPDKEVFMKHEKSLTAPSPGYVR